MSKDILFSIQCLTYGKEQKKKAASIFIETASVYKL